jgi:putative membrane protein
MSALADVLPAFNATLNGAAFVLILLAWRAIRRGDRARHRALMLSALGCSAVFLAGYLTRVALTGTHRFPGEGALRTTYLLVLGSHTVLAVVCLPLVLRSLFLAWKDRFAEHRRIARWTFPIWAYVSVTGVAVYALLYQVAPAVAGGGS